MDVAELSDLVSQLRRLGRDTAQVEVKRAKDGMPKSVVETLSAFANTNGGTVILGLDEETGFSTTGVDAGRMSELLGGMCRNDLEPPVTAEITALSFEERMVVVVEVERLESDRGLTYVKKKGREQGTYKRSGDGDHRMTTYEIHQATVNRGQPRDDERPVLDATEADLDTEAVDAFLQRLRRERANAAPPSRSEREVLCQFGVLIRIGDDFHPTRGGLAALGFNPQRFFPKLGLTFVHYPTREGQDLTTGQRFIDNRSLTGPIPTIVRDALNAIRTNMTRRSLVRGHGRTDAWEYPELALREAIVNALIHRDLGDGALGTSVQVEMYPDRITIRNPGGLYGPTTIAQLERGESQSSSRNARLTTILEDVVVPGETQKVVENRGSGIKTILLSLKQAGLSKPVFRNSHAAFDVTFPNHVLLSEEVVDFINGLDAGDLTHSQVMALSRMWHGESLTNSSYRSYSGLDSSQARAELKDLQRRRIVDVSGATSSTQYRLARRLVATPSLGQPAVDRQVEILRFIGQGERSRREIQEAIGLSPQQTRRHLLELQKDERIKNLAKPTSNKARYVALPPYIDGGGEQLALDV